MDYEVSYGETALVRATAEYEGLVAEDGKSQIFLDLDADYSVWYWAQAAAAGMSLEELGVGLDDLYPTMASEIRSDTAAGTNYFRVIRATGLSDVLPQGIWLTGSAVPAMEGMKLTSLPRVGDTLDAGSIVRAAMAELWYDSLIIVRNIDHIPADPSDGTVIATITDKSVTTYEDTADTTAENHYYAIYGKKGTAYSDGKTQVVGSTYWFDDFEDGLGQWGVRDSSTSGFADLPDSNGEYKKIDLTGPAHSGTQSLGLKETSKAVLIRKNFGENLNKVLTVWFYDDGVAEEERLMACAETSNTERIALGVSSASATHYSLWIDSDQTYTPVSVKRSAGWHQFVWDATSGTETVVYIDGVEVGRFTTKSYFNQVTLGWWRTPDTTANAFDDVSITDRLILANGPPVSNP